MRFDILDEVGHKIGEITDNNDSGVFTFFVWFFIIVLFVVLPIGIWYVMLFEPHMYEDNDKVVAIASCVTALASSYVSCLVLEKKCRILHALAQFELTWLISSIVTAAVVSIFYNQIFQKDIGTALANVVLFPVLLCELPSAISTVICRKFFQKK